MARRTHAWLLGGAAIGIAVMLACSREETLREEATAAATAPQATGIAPADEAARVRAELEKAAREIQGTNDTAPTPTTPESEEARKELDTMLQDVRKQLEQKASELGTVQPAEPAQP